MAQTRKYKIGCSGRGWGIWDDEGHKVMWYRSHYHAVGIWDYELRSWRRCIMFWNFNHE